jgi:NAD+ kinase
MDPIIVTAPTAAAKKAETELICKLNNWKLPSNRPVVFAVGGDGTMLQAVRVYRKERTVFVGISAGHLGFLQAFEIEQIDRIQAALSSEEFLTVKAPLLRASDSTGKTLALGFNDISIERAGARALRLQLRIDGSGGTFIGDGLIFATAFGSTAYSLAAGGPVIDTRARDVFVVTPNNPHLSSQHSSLQRPHVLHRGRLIRVSLSRADKADRPAQLVVDGLVIASLLQDDIAIALSDECVTFLELESDSFHARLETKRLGRT